MVLSNNQMIIALVANIFQTYISYRLMHLLFPQGSLGKQRERFSYGLYYVVNNVVYLQSNEPIMILLVNIILYGIISMQYGGQWTKRAAAIGLTIGLNGVAEVCVTLGLNALGYGDPKHYDDEAYFICQMAIQTVSYIIVLICMNIKRSRQDIALPVMYWFAIILVPFSTLFITATFTIVMTSQHIALMMICAIMMFGLNIMVFYLYDRLQEVYQAKMAGELLKRQNEAYLKELKFITKSSEQLKKLRHDFVHHVDALQKLTDQERWDELQQYLARIAVESDDEELFHTGNLIIDSGLNLNASHIRRSQITMDYKINIPEELAIEPFDLNVIFGNLLDNAIEAVEQLEPEQRQIKLQLEFDNSALYLLIANPCRTDLTFDEAHVETTKPDRANHGLGLKNVRSAVERYPGSYAHFYTEAGWFYGEILLYEPNSDTNLL